MGRFLAVHRHRFVCTALAIAVIGFAGRSHAENVPRASVCLMLESAAQAHDLPVDFFTRVIWRESRFDPDAVGPRTRSGKHAEGIAQFMPGTAAERSLLDPFDPVQALPKAADFLRELRNTFGNLGLAAAAYNAGPQRVRDWQAGARTLPDETRRYVWAITGRDVDEWAKAGVVESSPAKGCAETLASLNAPPSEFAYRLEQRVSTAISAAWGVELAAGFSRARVLSLYARAVQRLANVVGAQDPIITRTMWRSRGTSAFYRARIGADTRPAADSLCRRIRGAGGACVVMRNGRGTG